MVDVQVKDIVDLSHDSEWNNDRSSSNVRVDNNNENKEDGDKGLKRITELSLDDIFGLEFDPKLMHVTSTFHMLSVMVLWLWT